MSRTPHPMRRLLGFVRALQKAGEGREVGRGYDLLAEAAEWLQGRPCALSFVIEVQHRQHKAPLGWALVLSWGYPADPALNGLIWAPLEAQIGPETILYGSDARAFVIPCPTQRKRETLRFGPDT